MKFLTLETYNCTKIIIDDTGKVLSLADLPTGVYQLIVPR